VVVINFKISFTNRILEYLENRFCTVASGRWQAEWCSFGFSLYFKQGNRSS